MSVDAPQNRSSLPQFLGFRPVGRGRQSEEIGDRISLAEQVGFPQVTQEEDNWCWIALAVALEKYRRGNTISQCAAAAILRNEGCINDATGTPISGDPCAEPDKFDKPGDIQAAVRIISSISLTNRARDEVPTPNIGAFAAYHIERAEPLPILIHFPAGQGLNHYICIVARAPSQDRFLVYDPADGDGLSTCTISELSDYDALRENGRWTNFYTWA